MGIWDNSRYYTVAGGLPNCTTYVWVRCEEEGLPVPASGNAEDWPANVNKAAGWSVVYSGPASGAKIKYGDVIVSRPQHHVCFVNNDEETVSGSGYMNSLYLDTDFTVPSPGMTYRGDQSFWKQVHDNGWTWNGWNLKNPTYRPKTSSEFRSTEYYFYHKNKLSYEWGGSGTIDILRCSRSPSGPGGGDSGTGDGGGGGSDSGQEDGGSSGPGWYPEFGTIPETECGKAPSIITGESYNSGNQDNPKIPAIYSTNDGTREDGWWTPLTTRTYERIYIFDNDGSGNGHWSDWVETKSYSSYYGEQDTPDKPMPSWVGTTNEGWVLNWD